MDPTTGVASDIQAILNDKTSFSLLAQGAFEQADTNSNGHIDAQEMATILQAFCVDNELPLVAESDIGQHLIAFDKDKNGTIDFNEFLYTLQVSVLFYFYLHLCPNVGRLVGATEKAHFTRISINRC
jgi:hypothetical protein